MKTWLHGEVVIKQVKKSVPKESKQIKAKNGRYKIADSESTGNFHLLEAKEGVVMYEKDGTLYCKNEVPVNVFCVDTKRHDTIELPKCKPNEVYEITPAKEYDYISQEVRNVAD